MGAGVGVGAGVGTGVGLAVGFGVARGDGDGEADSQVLPPTATGWSKAGDSAGAESTGDGRVSSRPTPAAAAAAISRMRPTASAGAKRRSQRRLRRGTYTCELSSWLRSPDAKAA